ncbi:MAG TPA: hypothetical protein DCE41_12355 [Cytophagales bacterium]|nr:hypothetical protein [Cytophagales bacterium]HAA23842.1 hypothetical protein [Cytophagales bacterium]HAP58405.1 hypothetical protein [Cytophagales bacterium]
MTQSHNKKNLRLLITLIGLIILTGVVMMWEPGNDQVAVDRNLFSVADTAAITQVTIRNGEVVHTLAKTAGGWTLDGTHPAETSVIQVLLSLVHDVQVFRPVSQRQTDSVRQYLQEQGYQVTLYSQDQVIQDWQVGGSERTSTSYFMEANSDQPYMVHLPGYRSYLAGLFQMPANDWRQRVIISIPYNLLSSIQLDYTSENLEDVNISFQNEFFAVEGLNELDTGMMVQVIRQFDYFQTDYFINSGEFPRFDSLTDTSPALSVTVSPLDASQAQTLELWPLLPGDQYRLGRIDGELLLLEDSRIRWMFLRPQDFKPQARQQPTFR